MYISGFENIYKFQMIEKQKLRDVSTYESNIGLLSKFSLIINKYKYTHSEIF